MKRLPILLALVWLAALPGASAQNLPSSMAYTASVIVRAPADDSQMLLVTGNSLIPESTLGMDLSRIPAVPQTVVRRTGQPTTAEPAQSTATEADTTASKSKLARSVMLLGVLAIAYIVTRSRPDHRVRGDISKLRNFPKKRLAQREAHA